MGPLFLVNVLDKHVSATLTMAFTGIQELSPLRILQSHLVD